MTAQIEMDAPKRPGRPKLPPKPSRHIVFEDGALEAALEEVQARRDTTLSKLISKYVLEGVKRDRRDRRRREGGE